MTDTMSDTGCMCIHAPSLSFEIAALAERILRSAPPCGPGWSVTVKGPHGADEARLHLNTYDQVALFDAQMAMRGYEMLILDPEVEADFVFVPAAARAGGWSE